MKLRANFPDDLVTEALLSQTQIPCVCRVGREFEVLFIPPLADVKGTMDEWDIVKLDERTPALAGGQYIHHSFAMISLSRIDVETFHVEELSFFSRVAGWCPIVAGGDYGPMGTFWDKE